MNPQPRAADPVIELRCALYSILTRRENGAAHYEDLLSGLLAATPEQCRTYSY
jgi:hypothetical protein